MSHYALVQLRVGEVSTGQFSKDRVGPNTTSFSYVTAGARDVVVSATRLDDRPDLASITHLDFEPFIPCMARTRGAEHGAPADALIVGQCPSCRATKMALRRYGICWRHWGRGKRQRLFCEACGHRDVYSGGFFRIVEVLS